MLDNSDAFDEAWGDIAVRLSEINRTLIFSPLSVRYDLQRNLVEVVEELTRQQPIHPQILKSVREVAEGMIEGYEGRGRVHIGLRRLADKQDAPKEGAPNKIKVFSSLRAVFSQNAKADAYLLDCQLASRSTDGEMSLTPWGRFVLDYMDDKIKQARDNDFHPCINELHAAQDEIRLN